VILVFLLCASNQVWASADLKAPAEQVHALAIKSLKEGKSLFRTEKDFSVSYVKMGEDPWKMGLLQVVKVSAPLEALLAVIDNVPGYVGLFNDLKVSEVREKKSADDYEMFSETSIPFPFVPNDQTTTHYLVTRAKNGAEYRYSLVKGNHLKQFEGVAAAIAIDAKHSLYWEFDWMETEYGASRIVPAKKFWTENGISSLQSDWALKLKAENNSMPSTEALAESDKFAGDQEAQIASAYAAALPFPEFLEKYIPKSPSKTAPEKSPMGPVHSTANPKQSGPKREPKP
jgi:hypothetical protein